MLYQKLLLWDPSLGSDEGEEEQEEETSELAASDPWRPQDSVG